MRPYIESIMAAAGLFPFVAALFTLPYMVFQYRRYGAIPLLRTVILYSFTLYMMCAYFLTILPLPSREEVAALTTPYLQLTPFQDVVVWLRDSHFVLSDPSTWKRLVINRSFFVLVANVAMTVPFGIYLRYYFGCGWKKTLLLSLGLSLVFELTQLSALFGIYPRPYRLCETDDLITNTLGGMIGFWLAHPLMRALPSRRRMDEVAYRRGTHVSMTRRITAALVDWMILFLALVMLLIFVAPIRQVFRVGSPTGMLLAAVILYAGLVLLYFGVGEWLQKGLTPGKRLTHIRLLDERDGTRPKLWQCLVRYSLLYLGFLPLPFVALALGLLALAGDAVNWALLTASVAILVLLMSFVVVVAVGVVNRKSQLPHGALSRTRDVSTLMFSEDLLFRVGQSLPPMPPDPAQPEDRGPLLNG
ncbi:MAG: hypothetical protein GX418_01700 [Clostridiales bacterium]|nr:hypothetical protein [Clostridiales bacterium]